MDKIDKIENKLNSINEEIETMDSSNPDIKEKIIEVAQLQKEMLNKLKEEHDKITE